MSEAFDKLNHEFEVFISGGLNKAFVLNLFKMEELFVLRVSRSVH